MQKALKKNIKIAVIGIRLIFLGVVLNTAVRICRILDIGLTNSVLCYLSKRISSVSAEGFEL